MFGYSCIIGAGLVAGFIETQVCGLNITLGYCYYRISVDKTEEPWFLGFFFL